MVRNIQSKYTSILMEQKVKQHSQAWEMLGLPYMWSAGLFESFGNIFKK